MARADVVAPPGEILAPVPAPPVPAPRGLPKFALPLLALAFLAVVPPLVFDQVWNSTFSLAMIYGLWGLSVVVLTGFVGQFSLMPATFVGIGAFSSAALVSRLDTPFWWSILIAAVIAVPAAMVIGVIALRLKGLYLAIMTLVFANVIEEFLFKQEWFVGPGGLAQAPKPAHFVTDKTYYLLVLIVTAVLLALVWNFSRSRPARACFAVRDNETAAQAWGINVAKYKLMAFAMHGFIAGLAGALYAHWLEAFTAGGQRPEFGLERSLVIVFFTILGGIRSIWGPMLGGFIWVVLVQRLLSGNPNGINITLAVFGALVLATMMYRPQGLVSVIRDRVRKLARSPE
jgi:branched-chain amino acid transport system permease protein